MSFLLLAKEVFTCEFLHMFFSKRFEQYKAIFFQYNVVVQHCIFNISTRSDAGNLCVGDCGQDEGFHLDKTGSCLEFEICSLDLVDFLCPAFFEGPMKP